MSIRSIRCVIPCVGYSDYLGITLHWNKDHFGEVLVITTKEDTPTIATALRYGASVHLTNSFYENGANFNKFRAIEEGLDILGRRGWLCILDADILLPRNLYIKSYLEYGCIHSFDGRRVLSNLSSHSSNNKIPDESEWGKLPLDPSNPRDGSARHSECIGYCQIFHSRDPVLPSPPWHRVDLPNCAKGDSLFQDHWDLAKKRWLPYEVLHLGEVGVNWDGRKHSQT